MSCAVFTLLGMWILYAQKSSGWALRATFALAGFCLFVACYLAWRDEHNRAEKLDAQSRIKPRIVPRFPNPVSVSQVVWRTQTSDFTAPVVRIRFINDPISPSPASSVSDVVAKITIFDQDNIIEMDGRWTSSDQPSTRRFGISRNDLLRMSFGVGQEQDVDIATALPNGECWAINNDPMPGHPNRRLTGDACKVQVRLRGTLVDETYEFQMKCSSNGFEIEQPVNA